MSDRRHADWPLPPRCKCGARPDLVWPPCKQAVAEGRSAGGDVDAENCETWQRIAAEDGWLAPEPEGGSGAMTETCLYAREPIEEARQHAAFLTRAGYHHALEPSEPGLARLWVRSRDCDTIRRALRDRFGPDAGKDTP